MKGTHMKERGRAAIVVLGDLGRSPRMQYHALSLANQAKLEVDVIAYAGSEPHAALIHHPNIHLHTMQSPIPQGLPRALYLVALPWKMAVQLINLLWILCARIPAPTFFLVQNPPSIPTLAVVKLVCWIKKSSFIIDWHNFGYTLLGLSLGASHPFVKLYFWCEKYYGQTADGHICVTKAMQHELAQNWGIQATVLYDRSPDFFRPTSLEEKHELFCRLQQDIKKTVGTQMDCCSEDFVGDSKIMQDMDADKTGVMLATQRNVYLSSRCLDSGEQSDGQGYSSSKNVDGEKSREFVSESELTLLTGRSISAKSVGNQREISEEEPIWLREDRPALIVSSTSWTADEDFGMLLEAAVCYDRRVGAIMGEQDAVEDDVKFEAKHSLFPRLLIIVTGKGPMREEYEKRMRKLRLRRVAFRTMWVSAHDYPLLLGSADLGVCLHTSSSGLDLPMKVVDMFGCGLPVCAVSYSCIGELVKDRVNGLVFSSSSELADQFLDLFRGFPYSCYSLNKLRNGALISGLSTRWADEWEKQVIPLISQIRDLEVVAR